MWYVSIKRPQAAISSISSQALHHNVKYIWIHTPACRCVFMYFTKCWSCFSLHLLKLGVFFPLPNMWQKYSQAHSRGPRPSQSLWPLTKLKFLFKTQMSVETTREVSFGGSSQPWRTFSILDLAQTNHGSVLTSLFVWTCPVHSTMCWQSWVISFQNGCHVYTGHPQSFGLRNPICFTGSMSAVIFSIYGFQWKS